MRASAAIAEVTVVVFARVASGHVEIDDVDLGLMVATTYFASVFFFLLEIRFIHLLCRKKCENVDFRIIFDQTEWFFLVKSANKISVGRRTNV